VKNPRIVAAIAMLCEAFNRKPTDATYAAYEIGLAGLSETAVEKATAAALQKCKFMPTPSELRELSGASGGSFEAMAELAWHTLDKAVRSLGPDKSVNFHDGAINATVRLLGGWQCVCDKPREEFDKWTRKEFIATYVRLCRDGCPEELRRYHAGHFEMQNTAWIGRQLPGGGTYRLGMYGSEVVAVEAKGYQPALPAPEPQQRLAGTAAQQLGLDLKRIENQQ
jgi:hypothetical protein